MSEDCCGKKTIHITNLLQMTTPIEATNTEAITPIPTMLIIKVRIQEQIYLVITVIRMDIQKIDITTTESHIKIKLLLLRRMKRDT
jgi:hypothetical protein